MEAYIRACAWIWMGGLIWYFEGSAQERGQDIQRYELYGL